MTFLLSLERSGEGFLREGRNSLRLNGIPGLALVVRAEFTAVGGSDDGGHGAHGADGRHLLRERDRLPPLASIRRSFELPGGEHSPANGRIGRNDFGGGKRRL